MGQPRNCHQAAPRVAVMQNHRKTARKKAWLIRRTVTMRMSGACELSLNVKTNPPNPPSKGDLFKILKPLHVK